MKKLIFLAALLLLVSSPSIAQDSNIVKSDGVTSALHRANVGRVTFMGKPIPIEDYTAADFLSSFTLCDTCDFNIRTFLANSLTNYLHRLAPSMSAEELTNNGNYQFSFYVDGALIYKENIPTRAGSAQGKNTMMVFRVPLISTTNEDSWGRFLWSRFMLRGGEDALTWGKHELKIEIRPYLKTTEVKVGDLIASGEIALNVPKPNVNEAQIAIQPIAPNSGWDISGDTYHSDTLRGLNLQIAGNRFKAITSVVVIKNGKILIEEYFNGASRATLHDTRSVGKSFASALMGIAIHDGYIKNATQTLGDFYHLRDYANYSPRKDSVTLASLLTMSAAFEGSDADQDSPGNEEKMYPTDNWVKFALDLPMDSAKTIGKNWDYFTAGVILLGDILNSSVPGGLEHYADQKLFAPLGISAYTWQYTPQKVANTAGGLQMSSLDYAKFGQLYKNGGEWNGKQIIPKEWVDSSLTRHLPLPETENEYYGYLFWNKTFRVNGKDCETYYATGNGGSKIYIFTNEPLVVVITATAYGKPYAHPQVDKMMQKYILPAVLR